MPLRFTIQELSKYVEEIFPQVKDDFEILEISAFESLKLSCFETLEATMFETEKCNT